MSTQADAAAGASTDEFIARGVAVQRGACPPSVCELCLTELRASLERIYLKLPGPAAYGGRHIVGIKDKVPPDPTHRSGFLLHFSPAVEAVVRGITSGPAGATLVRVLGANAELCECTVIDAEPGATAQDLHSDGDWSATAPRLITLFIALHDVLDEANGATHYVPETHAPRCFPGGVWQPPPGGSWRPPPAAEEPNAEAADSSAAAAARAPVWFALRAGDCVLMEQTCWHFGGANTLASSRTILCASFVQASASGDGGGGGKKAAAARRTLSELARADG
jgi:hypothetical protein